MESGPSESYKSIGKIQLCSPESQKNLEKSTEVVQEPRSSPDFKNYLIIEDNENVDTPEVLDDDQHITLESRKFYGQKIKDDSKNESKTNIEIKADIEDSNEKGNDDDLDSNDFEYKNLMNTLEPGKNENIIKVEPESQEIPIIIKMIEVYQSIFDTSPSFKINNYLIKEKALKALKDTCPKALKLIGIYGISSVMKKFLGLIFEQQVTFLPQNEGVYLFYNPLSAVGVFAFVTPNEEMYIKSPLNSFNRFVVIIRILTDLCTKIVACISEEIIEKWYYEDNGTSNPFKPQFRQSRGALIEDATEQGFILDEVKVLSSNSNSYNAYNSYYTYTKNKEIFTFPKDGQNFLFIPEFESVSDLERDFRSISLRNFLDELLKLNDNGAFNLKSLRFFDKMKIRPFESYRINQDFRGLFEKMVQDKKNLLEDVSRKISTEIQKKFRYNSSKYSNYRNYSNFSNREIPFQNFYNTNLYVEEKKQADHQHMDKKESGKESLKKKSEAHKNTSQPVNDTEYFKNSGNLYESDSFYRSLHLENKVKNIIMEVNNISIENLIAYISSGLIRDLSYTKGSFIASIAEKYFFAYCQIQNTEEYFDIVEKIILDLRQEFTFQNYIYKYWGFKQQTIEAIKKDLIKTLKDRNYMTELEFKNCFEKELQDFIESPEIQVLNRLIKEPIQQYIEMLNLIENNFKKDCFEVFLSNEKILICKQLIIKKSEIIIDDKGNKNKTDFVCTIGPTSFLLKEFIRSETNKVNQIIGLETDVYFIFFSDSVNNKTYVLRFNPNLKTKDDLEFCKEIEDPDVKLAWGSSANKYIMFQNKKKSATHGFLKFNKYLIDEIALDIYSKVSNVVSSYFMKKSRNLYIIDDSGSLFCKELASYDSDTYIMSSPKRANNSDIFEPLKPKIGTKFLNLEISNDENIFFLETEEAIEFYDKNFIHYTFIPKNENFLSYKKLHFNNQCFIIIQNKDLDIKCFKVIVPKQETKIINSENIRKFIEGNPIFDIHHIGIMKFGPLVEETQIIKGTRSLGYFSLSEKNIKILNYLKNLRLVKISFDMLGYVDSSDIFKDINPVEISKLLFTIRTRMPLQIASVQNGNLIPFQNGVNNFKEFIRNIRKEKFSDDFIDNIKFGNYEKILEDLKGMIVLSIIGRNSSGKKYLLNRLAGTRFEMCTDGIWMGIGYFRETPLVVFDCEHLYTSERSTQEEIKLHLFISSLSDLIILNSDLSSIKFLKGLFDTLGLGVDRLKGKNLFRGYLDITYRDIPDSQKIGAQLEFNKFLQSLLEAGKKETLLKLFNKDIRNSLYTNFESSIFDDEVENKRFEYSEIVRKWPDDINFGLMVKIVLMQIFTDDSISADLRFFSAYIRKFRAIIDKISNCTDQAKKYLKNEVYKGIIQIESKSIEFSWVINEFYKDDSDPLLFFKSPIFTTNHEPLFARQHNILYKQLSGLIKIFFEKRKGMIVDYFKSQLPKSKEYKDQMASEILKIENKLDIFTKFYNFCLKKCELCDFYCTGFLNHLSICDCGTDHICKEICSICGGDSYCELLNGHKNRHICKKLTHNCQGLCNIMNCNKDCSKDPEHEGDCKCANFHPCREHCELFSKCGQLCKYDLIVDHPQHNCENMCPFKCIFDDGNLCSDQNHFHDFQLLEEESENHGKIKRHLCGTAHSCQSKCVSPGVCNFKIELVSKLFRNKYNEFIYTYTDQIPERLLCKEVIQAGEIAHGKAYHICSSTQHFCEARCPDCNCFCEKPYGHYGLHLSNFHRNKELSEYISIEETFSRVVQVENISTTVTFMGGDSASFEFCDQYCIKKGRGHSHPMPCRGGDLCLEKTDRGFAIHSNQIFSSRISQLIYYDFVTCDTYWMKYGWAPPNSKNQDLQKTFSKCNFYYNHASHIHYHEKIYCEGPIFHSFSENYSDHDFKSNHLASGLYNIVFIVDCTGSMSSYFSRVQNAIKSLISNLKNKKNRFAIIAYTDHYPDHGNFSSSNPVSVFPSSYNMKDGDSKNIISFIDKLTLSGEGINGGKAMIDGIAAANKLVFQENASKIYFVIADDTPHGLEFNSSSVYPDGCPCNYKWRDLLQVMKVKEVDFIMVQLSDILNKTVELFKNLYGDKMSVMPLNEVDEFQIKVPSKASQSIENNFVLSTKPRK